MRRLTRAIGMGFASLAMIVHNLTAALHSEEPVPPPVIQPYILPSDGPESEEIRRYFIPQLRPAAALVGSNTVHLPGRSAGTSSALGRLTVNRHPPQRGRV